MTGIQLIAALTLAAIGGAGASYVTVKQTIAVQCSTHAQASVPDDAMQKFLAHPNLPMRGGATY